MIIKVGFNISLDEFLRTNFRKPDDSGRNYKVEIAYKKSDNYDEYPEYVPPDDGTRTPAQTNPHDRIQQPSSNNIPQELIGGYSRPNDMYVAISENEIALCFSSFDDKQRFIIDGEEHSFQDGSALVIISRISTIGRRWIFNKYH